MTRLALLARLLATWVAVMSLASVASGDAFVDKPIGGAVAPGPEAPAAVQAPTWGRVGVSLMLVAGVIVATGWAFRRCFGMRQEAAGGPVRLVGRTLLTPKHQVFVIRVGRRLVVAGDSGSGLQPLCEITDPLEVAAVVAEAGADADLADLRGQAFAASLAASASDYDDRIEIGSTDPNPPAEPPAGVDDLHGEVRGLIDRVRRMTSHVGGKPVASDAGA